MSRRTIRTGGGHRGFDRSRFPLLLRLGASGGRPAIYPVVLCALLLGSSTSAAPPRVTLVNLHTREALEVAVDSLPAPSVINRFLRCAPRNKYTLMDPRLVQAAVHAARHFQRGRVIIVSAFRTSRLNAAMRAEGRNVALRSRHINGQALDLRIPGVTTDALCRYFRSLRLGGVGCYSAQRFVHVDVGPIRTWGDEPDE